MFGTKKVPSLYPLNNINFQKDKLFFLYGLFYKKKYLDFFEYLTIL